MPIISTLKGTKHTTELLVCNVCGRKSSVLFEINGLNLCSNCKLGIEGFTAYDGTVYPPKNLRG